MTTPVTADPQPRRISGKTPPPARRGGRTQQPAGKPSGGKSGTIPPPVRKVQNRPPVAPGMGPSKVGTPPPPVRRKRQPRQRQGGQQRQGPSTARQVRQGVSQAAGKAKTDATSYQSVILAEFVAAVLL